MNPAVFRRAMFCTCWLPILGSLLAVSFQVLRFTNGQPEYTAMGKIMAGRPLTDGKSKTVPEGFYETQIEMLQSGNISRLAMERVHGLYPELNECIVDITVTQAAGSSILNVGAIGSDRKYTRAYLDAVLDEYMSMHREMRDREHDGDPVAIMERPADAIERAPDLWLPLIVAAAMGFLGGLLLMLVISLIAAARTASRVVPPPLP